MSGAGHNNPPSEHAFALEVDTLFETLAASIAGGTVTNDEQEAALDALSKDFLRAGQDAEKARKAAKEPHLEAGRAVDAAFKPVTDKATRGKTECLAAITPYRQEKQRLKDEIAAKARREAEEQRLAAQAALQATEDLDARYEAEIQLEAASKLEAKANRIDRAPTGLWTWHEAEIVNKKAAFLCYLALHEERFMALVQDMANHDARNGRPQRDGVTYHEKKAAR